MASASTSASKARAAVLMSLAADSLALGWHWIYDAGTIKRPIELQAPAAKYHAGKERGEFTHYGDQCAALLRSVAADSGRYDTKTFLAQWRALFTDSSHPYAGYVDGATRTTLQQLSERPVAESLSCGSNSSDLGGCARFAPLLVSSSASDLEQLVKDARSQTLLTHRDPLLVESAEYFARVAHAVVFRDCAPGAALRTALEQEWSEASPSQPETAAARAELRTLVERGLESVDRSTADALKEFGISCPCQKLLPGTVHLIAKYQDRLEEAMQENVAAGGDSAARGLLVGMILGAHAGLANLPGYVIELKGYDEIDALLRAVQSSA